MGEKELAHNHVRQAVMRLAEAVQDRFPEPVLARLWAAEQLRRSAEEQMGALLVEARDANQGRQQDYTWEELGIVLGISAQGARQRALRQRAR